MSTNPPLRCPNKLHLWTSDGKCATYGEVKMSENNNAPERVYWVKALSYSGITTKKLKPNEYDECIEYIRKSTADKQLEEILKPIRKYFNHFKLNRKYRAREQPDKNDMWDVFQQTLEIADKVGKE